MSTLRSTILGTALIGTITLTGEIVPGVECRALRLDDGSTIALSRVVPPYSIGDRVVVVGSGYAGSASCQQRVLVVESMHPAATRQ